MTRYFALEYWLDEGWYVGRLKEVPWYVQSRTSMGRVKRKRSRSLQLNDRRRRVCVIK